MTHPILPHLRLLMLLSTVPLMARTQAHGYRNISGKAQGTTYRISYRPAPDTIPLHAIDSILLSVEKSLSLYDSSSLICAFNRSITGVRIDRHLKAVVTSALAFSSSSGGAFDITIQPVMEAWGFGPVEVGQLPSQHSLDSLRPFIGYRHLAIRHDSLLKDNPSIRINCNGIAQGYTVDLLADQLLASGIRDYLVELGGEIRLNGVNSAGEPWKVGIEDPSTDRLPVIAGWIRPGTGAVTSSGNYRNQRSIEGRQVGHVMDPRTARPTSRGVLSVCVKATDAMTADALDNTCMVLGARKSLRWIRTIPGADLRIVYRNRLGRTRVRTTKGFPTWQSG